MEAGDDVGLATVYRVLTQFENAGLVERHNFDGGYSVFEIARGEHHDHMVCVDTNEVIEFHNEKIEALQHQIAEEHGYELRSEEHTSELQSRGHLVSRLLLEKKKTMIQLLYK